MSSVSHKLYNYKAEPPAGAWEGIAAALDETPAYAQKLYTFEQQPPLSAWDKISTRLAAPQAKVVPVRAVKLFKYAIAAAVLVAFAAGSFFYFKSGTGHDLANQNYNIPPGKKDSFEDTQHPPGATATTSQNDESITDRKTESETIFTNRAMVRFASTVRVAKNRMTARHIRIIPEEKNIIDTELPNRYMIATTAAGSVVRLPKKAYSDYACAERLTNTQCREKIASIQSKMAASVTTDFTDFIDLLQNLQEN